jgi:hypothetical protein
MSRRDAVMSLVFSAGRMRLDSHVLLARAYRLGCLLTWVGTGAI